MFDPTTCSPVEGSEGQIYAKNHFTSYIFLQQNQYSYSGLKNIKHTGEHLNVSLGSCPMVRTKSLVAHGLD